MKIAKHLFCMLLSGALPHYTNAAIYSNIISSEGDPTHAYYHFTISSWDGGGNMGNPCYTNTLCSISINHRHTSDGMGGLNPVAQWTANSLPCIAKSQYMNQLRACMMNQQPSSGTDYSAFRLPYDGFAWHTGDMVTQECVGLFYQNSPGAPWYPLPESICGLAPPPIGACSSPDNIVLDHRELPSSQVAFARTSTSFVLDCNQKVAGQFYLQGLENNTLPLGSGDIRSTLSISGMPLTSHGVAVNLSSGVNTLEITSTLSVTGPLQPGEHTGQGVLILALQ